MEDLPYRSPIREALKIEKEESVDEQDLSTLIQVRDIIEAHVSELSKNFNAFDTSVSADELRVQIMAKQQVYGILSPLQQAITDIVDKIHKKRG